MKGGGDRTEDDQWQVKHTVYSEEAEGECGSRGFLEVMQRAVEAWAAEQGGELGVLRHEGPCAMTSAFAFDVAQMPQKRVDYAIFERPSGVEGMGMGMGARWMEGCEVNLPMAPNSPRSRPSCCPCECRRARGG